MKYYIRIKRLNGRRDFARLVTELHNAGILHAEYHQGGWEDYSQECTHPHLKFEDEQEALVYALKYGGEVEKYIPVTEINQ